jgi:uncharacterized protein with NRDE domain
MCLILIAHRPGEQIPLLVVANRDEFYSRPTEAAGPWEECPDLIGGRDLVSGGSWFGARGARWASVTNIREGIRHSHSHRSRGWLVRDYLLGNAPPQEFMAAIAVQTSEYAGFNLLLGDGDGLWYCNNRGLSLRRLEPGIYGLSNHLLDTPWPKVVRAKQALTEALAEPRFDQDQVFGIMAETSIAADSALPETGIPLEWERALSAAFIVKDNYGTRCTTFFQRSNAGQHLLIERRFKGSPRTWDQGAFTW